MIRLSQDCSDGMCPTCQRRTLATLKAQAKIARAQAAHIPSWREKATARAERLESQAAELAANLLPAS